MAFPIQPLNLPDAIRPAQFNFANAFGGLGDAIAEARGRQALNSAIAGATDAQGNLDYGKAGAALAQAGLLDQARPLLALAEARSNRARTEGHQAETLAETKRHNQAVEGIAGQKVAQAGQAVPDGELDDDTTKEMAKQYRAGDASVFTNLGRGAQGAKNVIKLRREIARQNTEAGTSGADQAMKNAEYFGTKAGQRTLGNRSANIELAATEFKQMLPIATEASNAVNRTNYPSLNKVIQAFQEGTGDPNIVAFGSAVNTLVNTYARAISPTGVATVEQRNHARELLNRAWSQGQFGAATAIMEREIDAALASPGKVGEHMRSRFTGKGETPPAAAPAQAAPSAPPPVQNREQHNQILSEIYARGRAAIANGENPDDVLAAANRYLQSRKLPPIQGF